MSADSLRIEILDADHYSEWDRFVSQSEQGSIFCYSWWLDAITRSRFKIYVIFEKGEIVAGFPAAYDEQNRINEPPFTRTLGILFKDQKDLPEHKRASNQRKWLITLLDYYPLNDFVQTCTHHSFSDWLPFRWKGLKQTSRYTYLIDYKGKTEDDLRTGLNRGKKSMINKAIRHGLRVEESDDFELLYHFTELSYRRQGLKLKLPYHDLKLLDEAIRNKGNRLILKTVDNTGRIHAVVYIVFNNKSAYYLLSGSDPEYRKMGGQTLALWEAVKYFRGKAGCFNFGGSDIRNIEEYVRGFGGLITPYYHIYNEKLLHSDEIRYQLNELLFHLSSLMKAIRMRFFR